MAEYIERKPVIAEIDKAFKAFEEHEDALQLYSDVRAAAIYAPAVDVAPVVHGNWVPTEHPFMNECEDCSNCGYRTVYGNDYPYCPNCGAKMDGGDDNEAD